MLIFAVLCCLEVTVLFQNVVSTDISSNAGSTNKNFLQLRLRKFMERSNDRGNIFNAEDFCASNPCKNGGTCFSINNEGRCICMSHTSGKFCEIITESCLSMPCQNEATCVEEGNSFRCKCRSPYFGVLCEKSPCHPNPCQNDGSCKIEAEKAKCECLASFFGEFCEKGPCSPNPCLNNGVCKTKDKKATCLCKEPYWGEAQTCITINNEGKCICKPHSSGKFCEIGPCYPNPCQNNATCAIEYEKAKCTCPESYFGEFCEKGPCSPNPCLNNGVCVSKDGKDICLCKEPFWGEFCEKDFCSSNPCKNDGICMTINNEGKCICKPHSSGEFCEIGPCYPNPCQNSGSCRIMDGKAKCTCLEPYSGIYCEKGGGDSSSSSKSVVEVSTLPVCNCGKKSTQCYYDINMKKVCICLPGYEERDGTCSECYCGKQSWSCRFNSRGDKDCDCHPGYAQKNGTCVEMCLSSSDCLNEGICKRYDKGSFCDCGPYFSGDRCEKSEFCDHLKEKCEEIRAVCVPTRWKTTCECPKGKIFTPRGICEDICDSAKCLFGKCEAHGKTYRCICDEGFSGFLCDINNNFKTNISILGISLIIFCFTLLITLVGFLSCGCQNIRYNTCDNSKRC
ncbi:Protein eyes shut like protein [Argiope bruennichi]|uniref:Protein eyes shut like protein n=1 Tax=Argiope bruennichi TaxID=94029 RepID=A0A8T0EU48_ARGBR|nr:Protein eyes shut like protein [Argiope bruennichi]